MLQEQTSLGNSVNSQFAATPSLRPERLVKPIFDLVFSAHLTGAGALKLWEILHMGDKSLEVRENLHMVSGREVRPEASVAGPCNAIDFREKLSKKKNLLEVQRNLHMGCEGGNSGLDCRRRPAEMPCQ
jgi:hypothetical protein